MLKWGVERRLEFIEFRLFWEGGVNRADLIDTFGVSVPQASKDLTLYQEQAPHNAVYNKSAKRYVAGPEFTPLFHNPDPDAYLLRLRSSAEGFADSGANWLVAAPEVDVALTPRRKVDVSVLRAVLTAVREGGALDVHYQSMSRDRPDPVWRRITPHAFGYDGFRWHARAWCHETQRFKDFLLPRILGVGENGAAGASSREDAFWHQTFDIVIAPHPDLSPGQQAVVAKDYGMTDGRAVLTVRYAMLFYVLKRLGLLEEARSRDPRSQHIVASNTSEISQALERVRVGFEGNTPVEADA
ncbi:WYL domain-containing protein [Rhizobium leguminosarum]|uniref:WYL domain-containing protein n=1 Tax=Rhizobium leguminosarum TaxID=384 RepID=UPI00103BF6A5|nr:WYL domain-containing protein [Rhizobium leguminosarum]TCA10312.1 WYL domain-containing protein [Rhizobium leguminosarum bv. viciae]